MTDERRMSEDSGMPGRISHQDEYDRFNDLTGSEREALIKRTSRLVFDEELKRDTTQAALRKAAEHEISRLVLEEVIKNTATQVAKATVREIFQTFDIDPESRDEARAFRNDIYFVRRIRNTISETWTKSWSVVLLALIISGIYGTWTHLSSGPPSQTQSSDKKD